MKKLLLLLVRKYPYDFGEPFLESEMEKHLSYYDKIVILSQDVSSGARQTRIPPEGVDSIITATGDRKKLRRQDLRRAPKLFFHPDDAMREELQAAPRNLLQRGFLSYFEARCQRLLAEGKKVLKDLDIFRYDQITIYSYWLFANANVALYLKDYFRDELGYPGRIVLCSRAHRYDLYEEENRLHYLPYRRRLADGMDAIFPCSQDGTQYLCWSQPQARAWIQTQYLGTKEYGLSPEPKEGEPFHIVSCSRVTKVKRLERLIDELALLPPSQPVRWTHIGGGAENSTEYFDRITSYAAQKLTDVPFEFLGQMPNIEVYEYYRTHVVDVFVNCSSSEGLPVSLMEAASFGIPVIATDVGGSRELVSGENGFLLPRDFAVGELAEKLLVLLAQSRGERTARRSAARGLWEANYSAQRNYTSFAKMLSEL